MKLKLGDTISKVELSMEESQNQRDKRVEDLWQELDPLGHRELDLKGLQKGLKRLDHPLKNADELLRQIIRAVDTNGDGKMQYEEFRVFVEAAEKQLLLLFRSIDRDRNGRLDKDELQEAFRRLGCIVPSRRLAKFFDEIDQNRDGFISFDEWRDFLLFMPASQEDCSLMTAWSFYSSAIVVNAEGDSQVSDQTLESLGYFLAGAVSGAVSRTATAPLDRLKVVLLVDTKTRATAAVNAATHGRTLAAAKSAGGPILEAVKGLYKAGGIRTFFAGNGLNVIKIMPEASIRFGSYEASKRFLAKYEGHGDPAQISNLSKFVAGGLGGMTAQFCVYPIDTLKFRFQCETVQGGRQGNSLLMHTAKTMWAEGGLRAAYRGLGLGLIGMFPYSAIDIGTFELLKTSVTRYKAGYYGIHEEDAGPGNILTAVLGARSASGDIEIRERIEETVKILGATIEDLLRGEEASRTTDAVPPRDYRVDVSSASGDISGSLAFGSSARLSSASGDIGVNLLPVLDAALVDGRDADGRDVDDRSRRAFLATEAASGDSTVAVMEPLWFRTEGGIRYEIDLATADESPREKRPDQALRCMDSEHITVSGSVKARYPGSWEGEANLSTLTGTPSAEGRGLEIVKSRDRWPGTNKRVVARKGGAERGGEVRMASVSGDVRFVVG